MRMRHETLGNGLSAGGAVRACQHPQLRRRWQVPVPPDGSGEQDCACHANAAQHKPQGQTQLFLEGKASGC
jgi:hypothetical protein